MCLRKYVILLGSMGFLVACSEVDPNFQQLGASITQPKFSGTTTKTFAVSSYNSALTVTGECDMRTVTLEYSVDNGSSWLDSGSPARDCTDKTFSFTISDVQALGFSTASIAGINKDILLRARIQENFSDSSKMIVRLQNAERARLASVASGGGLMTGVSYKVFTTIGSPVGTNMMTGSSYKILLREDN